MNIIFNKIILHNFGSYGEAEVSLANKGFCLVSGKNNCVTDNALSNGSGKSFLWSAICYTITGETINGLRSNLKNINIEADDCWTQLEFQVDADKYTLTRFHKPKSDLKIIKNGTDISGKGVRESEQKLAAILPDLNKDLIASTIIIGQGMPQKFSSFSPAGRKEMLEKLTKSDFMIDDIKNRLAHRTNELNQQLRTQEDSILVHNTQLNTSTKQLSIAQEERAAYKPRNYEAEISTITMQIADISTEQAAIKKSLEDLANQYEVANNQLIEITSEKAKVNAEELQNYMATYNSVTKTIQEQNAKLTILKNEIKRLEAITDICPTCGQKLKGIEKPDTTKQKAEAAEIQATITDLTNNRLEEIKATHNTYIKQIDEMYDNRVNTLQLQVANIKSAQALAQKNLEGWNIKQQESSTLLAKYTYARDNEQQYLTNLQTTIDKLSAEVAAENIAIRTCTEAKAESVAHLDVLKKIDTLIKRDFRGYLLSNIISFIDAKAKEYAQIVFDNTDLTIYLEGNALEIMYAGKYFDNLSGGEKTRVDLILQFTIRDMLSTYLGYSSNIIVLDEVTDYLDKNSCNAVMNLITAKLQDVDSVFIISHHSDELQIPIDTEISIVKNKNGISEIQE